MSKQFDPDKADIALEAIESLMDVYGINEENILFAAEILWAEKKVGDIVNIAGVPAESLPVEEILRRMRSRMVSRRTQIAAGELDRTLLRYCPDHPVSQLMQEVRSRKAKEKN